MWNFKAAFKLVFATYVLTFFQTTPYWDTYMGGHLCYCFGIYKVVKSKYCIRNT